MSQQLSAVDGGHLRTQAREATAQLAVHVVEGVRRGVHGIHHELNLPLLLVGGVSAHFLQACEWTSRLENVVPPSVVSPAPHPQSDSFPPQVSCPNPILHPLIPVHFLAPPTLLPCIPSLHPKFSSQNSANQAFLRLLDRERLLK